MRLRLTIAYDGTHFSGWQSQPDGRTVQDHIERAFAALVPARISLHGAGRTDAGVHASGQCAHVDVPEGRFSAVGWLRAINAHLPAEIRILSAEEVGEDFHARFSARGKIYCYTLWAGPVLPPMELHRAWHVYHRIDLQLLRDVANLFTGEHDFAAFSANRSKEPAHSTVRTIRSIDVTTDGERIRLTFEGDGFLYKMVRMLTAAAVRCATGRITVAELSSRLANGTPRLNHVAPAEGLRLLRVLY